MAATSSSRSASASWAGPRRKTVKDPSTGEVIAPADTYIDEELSLALEASGVSTIKVRSPLTCETRVGVCATCYGRDLARGTPVNMGEASA
jgi:DNA-directed RNA polymerase subunit beta'